MTTKISSLSKTKTEKQNVQKTHKIKRNQKIQILTLVALFTAMAYILHFFQVKAFSFLTYEPKNIIVTLSGLVLGPFYSVVVCFFAAFLELITTSDTGWYGFLMNFIAGVAYSLPIVLIYRVKKNTLSLIIGLITGTLSLLGFMCLLNLAITPLYLGNNSIDSFTSNFKVVVALLPTAIVPFNTIKGILDSIFIMAFIRPILHMVSVVPGTSGLMKEESKVKNIIYAALTIILVCVAITLLILMITKVIG